ncbi:MAG: TlpA family protein disulfide reductase [Verrucomicrobia bacterium]|nr:TlpA family protein disulfide reductase [Prolixibacteraceae bacterium]
MKTKIVAVTLLFLSVHLSNAQDNSTKVKLSDPVPSFDFEKSPGVRQDISDLKGKVVLITFFATWCGPCRKELPHIESDIYKKYKNHPQFELLIFGREHNWADLNKFKADNKFEVPMYPDPNRAVYSKFATQTIPRSFLISPEGKIIYSSEGFVEKDFEELKDLIKEQLRKL